MSVDHSAKENTRATCSHECRAVGDEVSVQPELSLGQLMRKGIRGRENWDVARSK